MARAAFDSSDGGASNGVHCVERMGQRIRQRIGAPTQVDHTARIAWRQLFPGSAKTNNVPPSAVYLASSR